MSNFSSCVSTTTAVSRSGRTRANASPGHSTTELVGARHALARRVFRPRIDADRVPTDRLRGGAERLAGVDGADDDQTRRRAEHLCEHAGGAVLELAAPLHVAREYREPERVVADDLAAVEQHQHMRTRSVAVEHGEEHGPLLAVSELEQQVGEGHSSRSRKTSISPPHGRPTPSACSSEMP